VPTTPDIEHYSGRVAALSRWSPDSPDLTEARGNLAAAKITRHIEKVVAEAPPLTSSQIARITAALGGAK
jgi:hypothetical protein